VNLTEIVTWEGVRREIRCTSCSCRDMSDFTTDMGDLFFTCRGCGDTYFVTELKIEDES